jgi:hypothetical protein
LGLSIGEVMPFLDIDAIRLKKQAIEKEQNESVAWCVGAISEFTHAAQELGTPSRGNPDFLKQVFNNDAYPGVWPILRDTGDNPIIEIASGASMTMTGKTWLTYKEAPAENVAWWISARCHYSIDVMKALFEAALLGAPWNVQTALNHHV